MKDLTREETIAMLYGMLFIGGLSKAEHEIIESAIKYLEEAENADGNDN